MNIINIADRKKKKNATPEENSKLKEEIAFWESLGGKYMGTIENGRVIANEK